MSSESEEAVVEWEAAARAAQETNADAIYADLESRYMAMKQEKESLEEEKNKDQYKLVELQAQTKSLQESLLERETELAAAKRECNALRDLKENRLIGEKAQQERMSRMEAEADNLREEISRLTESNKSLSAQVVEMEAKSKLTESSAVPLAYEVERTRKELDSLSAHTQWLEMELQERNDHFVREKQKHSEQTFELTQKLDMAVMERDEFKSSVVALKQSQHDLRHNMETLSLRLKEAQEEAANITESSQQELEEERRLVGLQKEQLDRLSHLHNRMVEENKSLREMANRASEATRREVDEVRLSIQEDSQRILQEQNGRYAREVNLLKSQLEEEKRRRQEAEDSFLASPRQVLGAPGRPALMASEDEPILGLTGLHEQLNRTQDDLRREQTERKRLRLMLDRIVADISAQTPKMVRQRQEYELARDMAEESRARLEAALEELASVRQELKETVLDKEELQKEVRELKQESTDMAKQVQALLVSRSGGEPDADIPISIEEIQTQNQQLLQEHRRLSSVVKDLEEKLQTDTVQREFEEAKDELATMRDERDKQESLTRAIVQQRDLYRALLSQHDIPEGVDPVASQMEKTKELERWNGELETSLAKARSDQDALARDKETLEHRMTLYEAHTTELTSSVNKLQTEVTSAHAAVARTEADATYHREKCFRMEEALQQSRSEVQRLQNSSNQLHAVNSDLQKAVSSANNEAAKWEQQLRQAEMKLRLAGTQVETSKASELRLANESTQLRSEIARQGALLESVQRIEASLSAKNEEVTLMLKEEVEKLQHTLLAERSKHFLEIENFTSRISELEVVVKSAEAQKGEALLTVIEAKKEGLTTAEEVQRLTSKCAGLEAELRKAKRKLGEDDTETENAEVALEAKMLALTADLDTARTELAVAKERVTTYQNLAKTNEDGLSELTKATDELKKAHQEEVNALKVKLEALKKESETKHQLILELTGELANKRGVQDKAVEELEGKVATLEAEAESLKIDAEVAESRVTAMDAELAQLRAEATAAQNNYERELNLHSAARTALRVAREDADSETLSRRRAEEQLELVNDQIEEERKLWEEQKKTIDKATKNLETSLEESRSQNVILHKQLATQADQLTKLQSDKIEAAAATSDQSEGSGDRDVAFLRGQIEVFQKTESELREIVRYMRSENEASQAREKTARRNAETERATAAVTKRSLDEARVELKLLRSEQAGATESDVARMEELNQKLAAASQQLTLLRDSNQLLREESDKMRAQALSLQSELSTTKSSMAPNEKRIEELELSKSALQAENASLSRQVEAWQGRMQKMLSRFNQIDPDEHDKALKQVEELKKKCDSLKSEKDVSDKANENTKTLVVRLNKELTKQRALSDAQKKKLLEAASPEVTRERDLLKKKVAQLEFSATSSSDAPRERDQFKAKVIQLEKELMSIKKEKEGVTTRNESLVKHLRNFQKQLQDQKKQNVQLTSEMDALKAKVSQVPPASKVSEPAPAPASDAAAETATPKEGAPENSTVVAAPNLAPEMASATAKAPAASTQKEATVKEIEVETLKPAVPEGGFKFGPGGKLMPPAGKIPLKARKEVSQQPAAEIPETKQGTVATQEVSKEIAKVGSAKAEKSPPLSPRSKSTEEGEQTAEDALRAKMLARKKKRKAESKNDEEPARKRAVVVEAEPSGEKEKSSNDAAPKPRATTDDRLAAEEALPEPKTAEDTSATGKEENTPDESSAPELVKGAEREDAQDTVKASEQVTPSAAPAVEAIPVHVEHKKHVSKETKTLEEEPNPTPVPTEPSLFAAPSTFGSGVAFGSSTTFGKTPFGGKPFAPLAFGVSSTLAKRAESGEAPSAATTFASAASVKPATFGSGGAFLDMKPPSAAAPKFTFGSSTKITLPTPGKGLPAAPAAFGAFGTSSASPFGGIVGTPTQSMPLFGAPAKRPHPNDDEDGAGKSWSAKQARSEDDDEEEGEEQEEQDELGDEEADVAEGEDDEE